MTLSAYFMIQEILQVMKQRIAYFFSVWNVFDIVTPILVTVVAVYQHKQITHPSYTMPNFIVTVHSFAILLIWIKFLYFGRIFRYTGNNY